MSKTLIVYYSRKGENYWNGSMKNKSKMFLKESTVWLLNLFRDREKQKREIKKWNDERFKYLTLEFDE